MIKIDCRNKNHNNRKTVYILSFLKMGIRLLHRFINETCKQSIEKIHLKSLKGKKNCCRY